VSRPKPGQGERSQPRQNEADIKGFQKRLPSTAASNPASRHDEYRALCMRWNSRKNRFSGCEDKILELMIGLEIRKIHESCRAELRRIAADVEKEKAEARVRTAETKSFWLGYGKARRTGSGVDYSALAIMTE